MITELKWKEKHLTDKSGSWLSLTVPIIKWEYIVESTTSKRDSFRAGVYYSQYCSDVSPISNKTYKNIEQAMKACENHFNKTLKNFNNFNDLISK